MRSNMLTLHDPRLAREFYERGLWQDDTFYTLASRHAGARPGHYAFRDAYRRLTWQELARWADSVAADLHEAGVKTGDIVASWLPNRVECWVLMLACSRNGYVCTLSLHQNHTVDEVLTLLQRCNVAAFVGQDGYGSGSDRKSIFDSVKTLEGVRRVYAFPAEGSSQLPNGTSPFPGVESSLTPPPVNDNPDKVTYLAFTSGTTGAPKVLMHSDNTLLANGRAMVADWAHTCETIMYCLGPQSHHLATVGLEQCLASGCEMVVNDLRKGEKPLDRIIESGASYVMGVPTHAIDILVELDARNLDRLGNVSVFYLSGAAIPAELARRLLDRGIKPKNTYGMSENGSHTSTLPTDDFETLVATVGQTVGRGNACYELHIFRADNRDVEVPQGEIGEIGGRGASLMLGYFGNQTATRTSFNSLGWFMSGDLGRFNEKGDLEIIGRLKDLIIRGGHNIYPAEIEGLAITHPRVMKAAAFPVADDRLGEKVCLGIIAVDGEDVPPDEMLAHLFDAGLSKYDMPEYFICMREFPMTASGKILKRELTTQVRAGQLVPQPVRWTGRKETSL
ncbi:short-chain-fatty-acid--CoA ligase (plasmid) [Paraburkholderia sp. PGU19]|uniref:class I adenylate-forming enzyme family protein n=1 Tax=Paraburkholderia sp. PGU19 TaxID=2735434 RepID=UPI0015DACEB1|nr:class I adenylate-forming enzyme family protein [Paraburkholderia sp. PGU19]BCG04200.1 short-chain-fatty-acid--CoA ligase [Paraburkholderia sp. PGU19]